MSTEKKDRYEIRLSGSGGQGLILAGVILGEAAGIHDGKNVVQTQSYGPEARGGASRSDVIISDYEIYYPKTMKLDLLLALTKEAYDKYRGDLKDNGLLIVDSWDFKEAPENAVFLPMVREARETLKKPMVGNIIALGVIAELSGIVSKEALTKTVLERVPKGTEEINCQALELGYSLARQFK
ncbi:MAG: 2-oxoacid:acceptor oxidoreductase family protein [Acidobacteriota bacterium]